jgi:hypothetical protein
MTKSADEAIRAAMERGEFDNLPNKGKQLNLKDYFDTPEDLRIGYSVLKSADFVPEEVQLLKDIGELHEKLAKVSDEAGRKRLQKEMEARRLKYNLLIERFKKHGSV